MTRDLAARFVQFFIGLGCVGLGVALMVDAGVGLSPWDVLHQGIHEHTNVGSARCRSSSAWSSS